MDSAGDRSPILVTGAHRSGTTWVGKMLALAEGVGYIHEPFNPMGMPGVCNPDFPWFAYVTAENSHLYYKHIHNILNFRFDLPGAMKTLGLRPGELPPEYTEGELKALDECSRFIKHHIDRARPLMKDPIALLAAEWLASVFGMRVVVIIRHPAAFVNSLKRLDWNFQHSTFLSQPSLMRDYLHPFKDEIEDFVGSRRDVVDSGALAWKYFYYIVNEYRRKHPDWIFLRHEDISLDPVGHFKGLYQALNLNFTPRIQGEIESHSDSENSREWRAGEYQNVKLDSRASAQNWKRRLSQDEIRRIRKRTEGVAELFYKDEEW